LSTVIAAAKNRFQQDPLDSLAEFSQPRGEEKSVRACPMKCPPEFADTKPGKRSSPPEFFGLSGWVMILR